MVQDLTKKLDKLFHDRVRLGVMSILVASSHEVSFTELVDKLDVSRGNLSVHIKTLESAGYLKSFKEFINNKPRSSYRLTEAGREAFTEYLQLLEQIIKGINK